MTSSDLNIHLSENTLIDSGRVCSALADNVTRFSPSCFGFRDIRGTEINIRAINRGSPEALGMREFMVIFFIVREELFAKLDITSSSSIFSAKAEWKDSYLACI